MMHNFTTRPIIQTLSINNCLGYSRSECLQVLLKQGINSIAFGHWLAIPSQKLLLIFRHQHCVAINSYQQK